LLKRGIAGTYVSVEPFHLHRYLDEQTFRYNNRKDMNDGQRFELAMSQVFGKRLTYSQLTGKNDSPHHEATGTGKAEEIPFLVSVGVFRFARGGFLFGIFQDRRPRGLKNGSRQLLEIL
jgi:hypothetical protein